MLALYLAMIEDEDKKVKFEQIYYNYKNQMFYVANSVLNNIHDAEDAVQEAFISIAKNMNTVSKIDNEKDLRAYILKATKSRALNIVSEKKEDKYILDIDSLHDLSDDLFLERVCMKFEYDQVVSALGKMDSLYRDVLYYHFCLEFTAKETAEVLNEKLSTVKQRLVRGKKILLKLLEVEKVRCDING